MIEVRSFGEYKGREVKLYVLKNNFLEVGVSDFGSIIQYIKVNTPSKVVDITLGFNTAEDYVDANMHTGGTIGRVANRIGGARFALNGKDYFLDDNDNGNNLHSGFNCYDIRFFDGSIDNNKVKMTLFSKDGDQGYPGNLNFTVEYELNDGDLIVNYSGVCDEDSLFCPTNHSYFNLNGENSGKIYDTLLFINADKITPVNEKLIPDGSEMSVEGTPFDFRDLKPIGRDLFSDHEQINYGGGYDHNFIAKGERLATAIGLTTGIKLDIYSDYPGVQFYAGNMIEDGVKGKSVYGKHCGFCLEPQYFPNAINYVNGISPIIKKGEAVKRYIRYSISLI